MLAAEPPRGPGLAVPAQLLARGTWALGLLAPLWWGVWASSDALEQAVTAAALLLGLLPRAWTLGPALALWLGRRAPA